jgi:enamine deaminase RidA (YjgF/YER057c/UK114 family)
VHNRRAQKTRETPMANVRFLNPKTISKPPGYTHVVEATGPNRLIYIAGQLGLDLDGKVVGGNDVRAQFVQTFENVKAALAAAGASFRDVVKMNNYLTDLSHLPIFREVRDLYVNTAAPPASTTIQISKLAREGAFLESEAIAILPAVVARASVATAKSKKSAPRVKTARRKRK